MPDTNLSGQEALEILQLVNTLAPVGVSLVKSLATSLQGKSDEELKAAGDAIDDLVIQRANEELAQTPPAPAEPEPAV